MSDLPDNEAAGAPASEPPQQGEMPFAIVLGTPITEPPKDLYIPPDALEVFLDVAAIALAAFGAALVAAGVRS